MRDQDLERRWTARQINIAQAVEMAENGGGCKQVEAGRVTAVRILLTGPDRGTVLMVVKATGPAGDFVGFVGGLDVGTAYLTWLKKERGAGLQFREDLPYKRPAGGP